MTIAIVMCVFVMFVSHHFSKEAVMCLSSCFGCCPVLFRRSVRRCMRGPDCHCSGGFSAFAVTGWTIAVLDQKEPIPRASHAPLGWSDSHRGARPTPYARLTTRNGAVLNVQKVSAIAG